jgi:hypothetical protein
MKDLIPKGATRVQVTDEVGKSVWRKPSDLRNTDTIKFNPNTGEPYVMYGSPGVSSPQSASTPPTTGSSTTSNAVISAIKSRKKDVLDKDEIVSVAKSTPESPDILTKVIAGIAEESASLYFERLEAERKGESTSQISMRRVQALKAVGDTWLKKKEVLASTGVDLESSAFKIIFTHIAETFRQACDTAGVRPEMSESVFAEFGRLVDDQDWIADAKAKMEKGES